MEKVGEMEVYTFEEALDGHFGKIGTPRRDKLETDVEEAVCAYHIGEAIKKARQQQNLTQKELGNKLGVRRTQVSRIENGCNTSISTLAKVFKALNVDASLNVAGVGEVSLW